MTLLLIAIVTAAACFGWALSGFAKPWGPSSALLGMAVAAAASLVASGDTSKIALAAAVGFAIAVLARGTVLAIGAIRRHLAQA